MNPSIILLLLVAVTTSVKAQNPQIKTKSGWIEGKFGKSFERNRTYMQFLGIPYAKPPLRLLRFEPPLPAAHWNGVYKAHESTTCMQVNHVPNPPGGSFQGTEDCLHLNVFVPLINKEPLNTEHRIETSNLDVIVYIHGGAYSFSSGSTFKELYLMDQDVIYVSINYRLGVLGFLCTESPRFPGNAGLKDQVLALQWIKDNIRSFGGNPESITIAGLSAGAGSVSYHTLSPMSRGLFQRAISMSGSALRPMQGKPLENAKILGDLLGCNRATEFQLGVCLKDRSAEDVVNAIRAFRPWLFNPFAPFSAVVDGKWSPKAFLPSHPWELLRAGRTNGVAWLVSFVKDEGLYPAAEFMYDESYLPTLDENWNELAEYILHLHNIVSPQQMANITSLIRRKYLGNLPINNENFQNVVDIVSDRLFKVDLELTARLYAAATSLPVYMYEFLYEAEQVQGFDMFLSGKDYSLGVGHGDDTIFVLPTTTFVQTPNDKAMSEFLIATWMEFAKTGKLEDWTTVSRNFNDLLPYKVIGSENFGENRFVKELGNRRWWESLQIRQID